MSSNPYDQACRYLMRPDSQGMTRWLYFSMPGTARWQGWLDTRNIPFPGEAERTCDTVACFEDEANPGPLWAIPFEFQSEPDSEMFGRFLEYLGTLWRQKRPPNRPGEHYNVVGCLVNLTGEGNTARDFQFGQARTLLQPEERNVAKEDAAQVLNGIVAGTITPWVLALIPLMQKGSEPGIITQWLAIAGTETDERKRGDYGGLVLVFAELAGCQPAWKKALKGWNMKVSQQVLEWQMEGAVLNARETLRILLEDRFGSLPETLLQRIDSTDDASRLQQACRQVLRLQKLEDLKL
jgi:hypothetical protein